MATTYQGANATHQRFLLTIADESWGEFEDVDPLKITIDGEVTFFEPGNAFETKAGGNFKIDDITCTRHNKHGRDELRAAAVINAAAKGRQLRGTGSFVNVLADGTLSSPTATVNVIVNGTEGAGVSSKSGDATFKVTLGVDGAPTV